MRLVLDPRARRLLRRIPRSTVYSALELALLSLLALQSARLVWTIVTPVDPVGQWRASGGFAPGSSALLGQFDPFFRLSGAAGPVVVTSLNLKLFGVREDRATGRGAAIVALPDGTQRSFAVGDEIVPGVTLTAVGFDSVTISRSGTPEQLFLDQSQPAALAGAGAPPMVVGAPPPGGFAPLPIVTTAAPPVEVEGSAATDIQFSPRLNGRNVTGVTVAPKGAGTAFRAAGLAAGDVIVSVNGQRITSPDQARSLAGQISGNREVTMQVERNGRVVPLRVRVGQ